MCHYHLPAELAEQLRDSTSSPTGPPADRRPDADGTVAPTTTLEEIPR
ncbi:hypothetical protein JOF41_004372 [Saccharothrix coeruleofusca]|nr:hypothetical protein [Saccharothrix coeruleofusca]